MKCAHFLNKFWQVGWGTWLSLTKSNLWICTFAWSHQLTYILKIPSEMEVARLTLLTWLTPARFTFPLSPFFSHWNKAKQACGSLKILSKMIVIQSFSSASWAERELILRWPVLGILSGGSSHADPVVQTIPGGLRYHVQSSQIIYPSLPVENPPNITEYQC